MVLANLLVRKDLLRVSLLIGSCLLAGMIDSRGSRTESLDCFPHGRGGKGICVEWEMSVSSDAPCCSWGGSKL